MIKAELIITFLILLWGIGTTVAGLYLSYHNNFKQNTKVINLLEKILMEIKK